MDYARTPNNRKQKGRARSSVPMGQTYLAPSVPRLGMSSNDSKLTVHRRDYIWALTGSELFAYDTFSANPGMPLYFAWLSGIASRFEKYHFKSLKFQYEPTCAATTNGKVILAFDGDVQDTSPEHDNTLMQFSPRASGPCWSPLEINVPQSLLASFLYTRSDIVVPNTGSTDYKTLDIGRAYFATMGATDGVVLGDLFVEYTVELVGPQLNLPVDLAAHYHGTADLAQGTPFGKTATHVEAGSQIVNVTSDGSIIFNRAFEGLLTWNGVGSNVGLLTYDSGASMGMDAELITGNAGLESYPNASFWVSAAKGAIGVFALSAATSLSSMRFLMSPARALNLLPAVPCQDSVSTKHSVPPAEPTPPVYTSQRCSERSLR